MVLQEEAISKTTNKIRPTHIKSRDLISHNVSNTVVATIDHAKIMTIRPEEARDILLKISLTSRGIRILTEIASWMIGSK